jgi:hypothetical protein
MRRINVRQELVEQNRLRVSLENRFQRRLVTVFKSIGARCIEAIDSGEPLDAIYRDIPAKLSPEFQRQYNDVIELFAGRMLANLKPEKAEQRFEYLAREWYRYEGANRVREVSDTTRAIIQREINDGFTQELTQQQIAKNIRERTGGAIGSRRAFTIARTETHAAANFANNHIAEEVGSNAMIKRWVSANDNRTRPHHAEMNGVEVNINEDFVVPYKGIPYKMAYPGDPKGGAGNVINCRCVLVYKLPEDAITDPKEQQEATWGEATQEEIVYHKENWGADSNIRDAIAATRPVDYIKYKVDRAYCSTQEIAMSNTKDGKLTGEDRTIWRHEYGHWIDMQNRVGEQARYQNYASATANNEIEKDRRKIMIGESYKLQQEQLNAVGTVEAQDFRKLLKNEWLTADEIFSVAGAKENINSKNLYTFVVAAVRSKFLGDRDKAGLTLAFNNIFGDGEGLCFADFIGAITNERSGFGHGVAYYRKFPKTEPSSTVTVGHSTEAFANYTALIGGKNGAFWRKVLEYFAPATVKKFDQITEEIGKKRVKNELSTIGVRQPENEQRIPSISGSIWYDQGNRVVWGKNYRENRRNL